MTGTYPSVSHLPHVRVYPYVHPVTSYYGRMGHIPVLPHVRMYMYPYVHPILLYYGRVGHIPVCPIYHMYACILMSIPSHRTMGEWDISQSVPFTTCTGVSLCPSRPIVLWESGTYPSLSRLPHVRMYPYVHPIPSYYGRVGPIPVCPIYHMASPASPRFCKQHE